MSKLNNESENKLSRLIAFGYLSFFIMLVCSEIVYIIQMYLDHNLSMPHLGSQTGITDFVGFYIAGKIAASAQRTDLFNLDVFNIFYTQVTGYNSNIPDIRIFHLPFWHLLMAPLASLPIDVAHLLFDLITTLFGLWAFWLLIKQTDNVTKIFVATLLLGTLACDPAWGNWIKGQMMWLYAGLAAIFLIYFFNKQELKAGILLSLLSVKPHYAIYLAVPPLISRRYQLLLFAAISELVLFLICLATFGSHSLITYLQEFSHHELNSNFIRASRMNCIRSLLCLVLSPENAYRTSCTLDLLCLFIITILCSLVLRKKANNETMSWIFSLLILSSLLFGPHVHSHDCLLIAIPAILTLPRLTQSAGLSPSLLIWKWCLYLFPITSWLCTIISILGQPGYFLMTAIIAILWLCSLKQVLLLIQSSLGQNIIENVQS